MINNMTEECEGLDLFENTPVSTDITIVGDDG